MFDPECRELAKHFLPNATEEKLDDLAQAIQDAVEDYLEFERASGCEEGS